MGSLCSKAMIFILGYTLESPKELLKNSDAWGVILKDSDGMAWTKNSSESFIQGNCGNPFLSLACQAPGWLIPFSFAFLLFSPASHSRPSLFFFCIDCLLDSCFMSRELLCTFQNFPELSLSQLWSLFGTVTCHYLGLPSSLHPKLQMLLFACLFVYPTTLNSKDSIWILLTYFSSI